jgi:PAS domain S-box-containing protein
MSAHPRVVPAVCPGSLPGTARRINPNDCGKVRARLRADGRTMTIPPPRFSSIIDRFKVFYEKNAPEAVLDPDAPNHWKEKLLYAFVLVILSVGLVVLIMGIPGNIRNEYWLIFTTVVIGYCAGLLIFLFPKARYEWRAATLAAFLYFIGISIIFTVGPFLASREWLFAFSIMLAVLLGWPGAIASIVINLSTWALIGVLITIGYWDHPFHPDNALFYWRMIAMDLLFINIGTTIIIMLFFIRMDKSDRSARSNAQLLLDERNKLSEANARLTSEIEERKAVTVALRESEEKYRTILETIEDAYFEVDLRGNFTFFNRTLAQRLGYTDAELTGMHYRAYTDRQNAEKLFQVFNSVFVTGQTGLPVDLDIIDKHDRVKTVSILTSLICDSQGKATGFRGLARDVTGYKKMENRLQHAKKMEAVGTLASGVAHDLNNTLAGVVAYPELLLLNMPASDPLRKPILAIKKSGEKAVAIVQDLLTLARRGVAVKEVVNLNTIILEYLQSADFHGLQSFHPGVRIETQLDRALLNLSGSTVHLSKTVMNLVSNAAEAIEAHGTIHIATENRYIEPSAKPYAAMPEGECVVLTIRDTGEGIAPEIHEKIFEPFFTKKVMGRSGTGLGMAVVRGTVQDHGGHIDVKSTPGQGTTFTIYLPATREAASEEEPSPAFDRFQGNGERILIVDDVETQQDIAAMMLARLGYLPVSVSSGEEAVEYLKTRSVDLVLLDMIMRPGIDGLETYQRIIAMHPGQKAIIVSGFSETNRVKEALKLGAGKYLRKPYSLQKLGLAIKKELAAR